MKLSERRRHCIMSVFSMVQDSHFTPEMAAEVIGIKEKTVHRILRRSEVEYHTYVEHILKAYHHLFVGGPYSSDLYYGKKKNFRHGGRHIHRYSDT